MQVEPLDDMCAALDFVPDLVKIDVEGFELPALQGARRILARRPPLLLEIHPLLIRDLGYDHAEIFDFLEQLGYRVKDASAGTMSRGEFRGRHHTFFTVCLTD